MTEKEARKLQVGDRVVFSDGVQGTVEQTGYNAAQFKWDDGQAGVIHHVDMHDVARAIANDPRIEKVMEAMARTVPGRRISSANLRVLARVAVETVSREPVTYRAPWESDAPFE